MKKALFLTTKSVLIAFSLVTVFAFSALLVRAQSSPEANARSANQKLEGSWVIVITPILPPGAPPLGPFTAYCTFGRGGDFIGSARANEFSFFANPQHGVWEHRGGNRFALSFKQDLLDAAGRFTGVSTADVLLTLDGKDSFVGVTSAELHDADGHLILSLGCATITGERMTIGSLADMCSTPAPAQ